MAQVVRPHINASTYFQLPEYEQNTLIELINGEVIIGMPPILKHQLIVKTVLAILTAIEAKTGGIAFPAPTEVRLDDNNVFEPDVLYVKPDNLRITKQDDKRIIGAPNLIVEVLSPSTAKFDRQEKYQAYEKHGVEEYWIIDPVHDVIEVWHIGDNGLYVRQGAFAGQDIFNSMVLGESIRVKDIFDI